MVEKEKAEEEDGKVFQAEDDVIIEPGDYRIFRLIFLRQKTSFLQREWDQCSSGIKVEAQILLQLSKNW
jgi:hypothetical protein